MFLHMIELILPTIPNIQDCYKRYGRLFHTNQKGLLFASLLGTFLIDQTLKLQKKYIPVHAANLVVQSQEAYRRVNGFPRLSTQTDNLKQMKSKYYLN